MVRLALEVVHCLCLGLGSFLTWFLGNNYQLAPSKNISDNHLLFLTIFIFCYFIAQSVRLFVFVVLASKAGHDLLPPHSPFPVTHIWRTEMRKRMRSVVEVTGTCYVVCVLFGAPLLTGVGETLTMSLMIALFLAFHSSLSLPSPSSFFSFSHFYTSPFSYYFFVHPLHSWEMVMVGTGVGGVIGSWVGSVVIVLDWDTYWQTWPISSCYSAIWGCCLGRMVGILSKMREETRGRRKKGKRK